MGHRILGLDVGANSIGWMLVDPDAEKIIASGVRVFPEGVDNFDTKKEKPKMEGRRVARGMRRQIARRRARKRRLRELLCANGLLPPASCDQRALDALDPYRLRRRVLTERLMPHEFGRMLVHLNQRRGFKSNRKSDRGRKADGTGLLGEINELGARLKEANCQTLGEYLANLHDDPHQRIRNRHTRRDMFENEFEICWEKQRGYHPELLTDALKKQIRRTLFFQRDMYWPASVVGRCELEPRQARAPRADRLAQKFRLLQEVNNLRYFDPEAREEKSLDCEQRSLLLDKLSRVVKMDFDQIRKALGFIESIAFNLERGHRKTLKGMPTDCALSKKEIFGSEWYEFPESKKNEIVRELIDAEDEDTGALAAKWGLPPESTERLTAVDFPDGYAALSLVALGKLLPHMERGLLYMTDDNRPCALTEAGYLRPDQMPRKILPELPEPPEIANPVVRQAMFEVRKLVNSIIREFGKPHRIHIELARNATMSTEERQKASRRRQENEDKRSEAAEIIRSVGFRVSRDGIDRVLLWREQHGNCIYSGKPISLTQLLQGEADVDHLLPRSRCLDDSMQNKVVAFREMNHLKGSRTPREWLESERDRYDQVLQRASELSYPKRKRFAQKELELGKFVSRQLNDTRYIARIAAGYLRTIVDEPHYVLCPKGNHTAELRRHWGLDKVLRALPDSPAWRADGGLRDGEKNRSDHRHHSIDALVVALTDQSRLQQLARIQREGGTETTGEVLAEPWSNFRHSVEEEVGKIKVSHRVQRRVSGALHEDTIYGPVRRRDVQGALVKIPDEFVVRKPLEALTISMVHQIRDPTIRALVMSRLKDRGIDISNGAKGSIPKEVWSPPLAMASGVPIRRVRIRVAMGSNSVAHLGDGRIVAKGSNHHVEIFKDARGHRTARVVSVFDAAKRIVENRPIIDRTAGPGLEFVMSLSINEMVLVADMPAETALHRVQKMDVNGSIILRPHTYAGRAKDTDKPPLILRRSGITLRGQKVTVDLLGRIRWAND